MSIKTKLLTSAERLFDQHGFMSTSMDQLTKAADMSSRTLYKHAGGKTGLVQAVLTARDKRFMQAIDVQSIDDLFAALQNWTLTEGARGCLFLRAYGEAGGETPEITDAVMAHKAAFHAQIARIVKAELGANHPDLELLTEQILVLIEGSTSAAIYRGTDAITSAHQAATLLIAQTRKDSGI
ncbi:TetR/AcrR family transcriptional regulator [Thalassospira sp.]|uniref:TetR/AcrR family transcriptional regulator n=1 Tax=Thalassospira sp. TaxID=1912094 RepID=UPI000C60AB0C|nr:TetR/AcrR family transcriptional regulator [Thalassospira sp.]MBC08140.1 TetR family transcriptional regulator [Thalassospira sp.]|tara:strand:+ start:521 stop:1066 length:546 start_codon:yes stop_codon:yes gene_type:complete